MDNIYDEIADSFSKTRDSVWQEARYFLSSLKKNSFVLEAGCGNGKNMKYRSDIHMLGFDLSFNLLLKCNHRDVFQTNILSIPLRDNVFDAVICIAVIHHLKTFDERYHSILEMIRVLKKGGKLLIMCWNSFEGSKKMTRKKIISCGNNNFMVPWGIHHYRFYHLIDENEMNLLVEKLKNYVSNIDYKISNCNWNIYIQL
jgi:ubiquinone/menaquinone biosynthesis C-methylase UbiE